MLGDLSDGRQDSGGRISCCFRCGIVPIANRVELSVKAGRRLQAICRAWARSRLVSVARYYAPPRVARGVSRAVSLVHAHGSAGSEF